ncbi:MAG: 16S rRNA (guanine(966)-N(2))-methyltransferase RsmD [Myxococcales bacterium]|nr:16S rRNA (guanine(966)-N(2))-methyltransferase RsmD [Myxococcales bacterium]
MRIIAGTARATQLRCPPGDAVRPTSDFVRGVVVSMLGGQFDGRRVLDVCAGTGAVALECLSRGAVAAVAIESAPDALVALKWNAQRTRLADRLRVLDTDAVTALDRLGKERAAGRLEPFDLVYVDPPYRSGLHAVVLARLLRHGLVRPSGDVVVESEGGLPTEALAGWTHLDRRTRGAATLDRLEPAAAATGATAPDHDT